MVSNVFVVGQTVQAYNIYLIICVCIVNYGSRCKRIYIESAKIPAFYTFFEALGISKIYDNRIPQHSTTKWNILLRISEASIISLKSANNRHICFYMLNRSKCKLWGVVGGRFSPIMQVFSMMQVFQHALI